MAVFVLNTDKSPLAPCSERRARKLLEQGKAAIWLHRPFTLILKSVASSPAAAHCPAIELRIDPGSKFTGFALVNLVTGAAVHCAELQHRGYTISCDLTRRSQLRRSRRSRKTRYRPARFNNRTKPEGWLAPSLEHRVLTTLSWVKKYLRLCPIQSIAVESVKFDTQKLQNPEISGVEYQRGELFEYEVREYVFNKFNHTCVYCKRSAVPLTIEHVTPRSLGGSNRVSNLAAACRTCNQKRGNRPLEQFTDAETISRIKNLTRFPLKDAAAVNSTRNALVKQLSSIGKPVSCWTGGRTKYNRTQAELTKTHCYDAACVGDRPAKKVPKVWLTIKSMGRGNRQMVANDKFGFPKKQAPRRRSKSVHGMCTGDIAKTPVGTGRITGARTKGSFSLKVKGKLVSMTPRKLKVVQRGNGYEFGQSCAEAE